MKILEIIEHKDVFKYLSSRWILNQYKKAKNYILSGDIGIVDFKLRKPKSEEIFQFRINQKFRAFCYFEEKKKLVVFKISDHQDF